MSDPLNSDVSAIAQTAVAEVIDAVVESEAEAAETAEQIAAAAMESVRGQEINDLRRSVEECQMRLLSLPETIRAEFQAQMETLVTGLGSVNADALATLNARLDRLEGTNTQPSIPPISELPPAAILPLEVPPPAPEPEPARKKAHRFL